MHAFTSLISLVGTAALLATSASASPGHAKFLQRRAPTVVPTSPGPGDSFNEGSACSIEWTAGTSSLWKTMTISLMTGANQNMTKLTDVSTDIDGTTQTSHSWTCPEVSPNSAIYFYQFTDSKGSNATWTTRFTIAGADGSTTTPTESTQDGQAIPWGQGVLVSTSSSSSSSSSSSGTTDNSSDSTTSSTSSASRSTSTTSTPSSSNTSSSSSSSSTSGAKSLLAVQSFCIFGMASLAVAVVMA